jgi:hypothetical protein
MGPQVAAMVILLVCLILVVMVYLLGIEVGKAAVMKKHPGFEAHA